MAETLVKGRDIDMSDGTPRRVVINKTDVDSNPALDVNCYGGSGAAIDIQNNGTGPDIKGNGGLWQVAKDGKATFIQVNGSAIKDLDWDTCWSDPQHDHSSTAEGGGTLNLQGLTIVQNSKIVNLNADRLDDCHAGNSFGQIPVSNGAKCTGLYAEQAWQAIGAWDSDKVDGYHAGNSVGQVAVSNYTLCAGLNADRLDGYHATNLPYSSTSHTHSLGHDIRSYVLANDYDTQDQSISLNIPGGSIGSNGQPVWAITSLTKRAGAWGGDGDRVTIGGSLQGINYYEAGGGPYLYTLYYRSEPYYSGGYWRFWADLQSLGHNHGTVAAFMYGVVDSYTG